MRKPPFTMKPSAHASLICDSKHIVSGRASFVWETYLMRRVAGVPGDHRIRAEQVGRPWHRLDWSIAEAEEALAQWGFSGAARVNRCRRTRMARKERGLPVG